jgi:hypothetical protein
MSSSVISECGVWVFLSIMQRKTVWHNFLTYMRATAYPPFGVYPMSHVRFSWIQPRSVPKLSCGVFGHHGHPSIYIVKGLTHRPHPPYSVIEEIDEDSVEEFLVIATPLFAWKSWKIHYST